MNSRSRLILNAGVCLASACRFAQSTFPFFPPGRETVSSMREEEEEGKEEGGGEEEEEEEEEEKKLWINAHMFQLQ